MESKQFIKVLRKVIREELESVVKKELSTILKEGLQSTIQEISPRTINKKKNTKEIFKENKFADILNDTDRLIEDRNYKDLVNEDIVMTSNNAQSFGVQRNMQNASVMTDPESGKSMKVDPVIQNAMNRDYSALMKAMDKKRK